MAKAAKYQVGEVDDNFAAIRRKDTNQIVATVYRHKGDATELKQRAEVCCLALNVLEAIFGGDA